MAEETDLAWKSQNWIFSVKTKKNLKEIVGISYDHESEEGILKQDTKSLNHNEKDYTYMYNWITLLYMGN